MAAKKLEIQVKTKGVDKSSKEFDRMRVKTEGVERAVGQLRNKLLLFTFATAAVVGVVTKLTKASIEQEKIFNSLENAVNITGASYDGLKGSLDGYFASLQQSTIYGDTDTAQVLQQLTMLTGDYEGSIKALPYVLDLASSGMTDLGGATRYIGMGMSGNIEMLGRYIPEFKAATNETLKNMGATEKAAYMFDVLGEKVGGLAEKELNTTAGKWIQFKNYWGDLDEAIGDNFTGTLQNTTSILVPLVQEWTNEIRLHQTSIDLTSEAYTNMGDAAKASIIGTRIALLEQAIEIEKTPNKLQVFWRSVENSSNVIEQIFGVGDAIRDVSGHVGILAEALFGLEFGSIIDEEKIKDATAEIEELKSELISISDITSLETTIRELEELGVASKEILELKKFSWNVQLEDINAELKKAGVNYENIKDVTAEIKTLKEKDIAYTKAKARIQTEEITKISQIEDIYASIGASVEDYGRLHRNYNSYLSNSETELEAINMLEGLVLSTLMDETTEIKNQKKELADYSDLLIEREKLEKQIKLNGKKKIEFETSIKMLPFDTEGAKAAQAIEDENLEKQKEIWETKEKAEKAYQQQLQDSADKELERLQDSADKELERIALIAEAEKRAVEAKMMMEEAAFRMAEKHDGDAIGAAKEVIRNEAKEALAGYISSVLTGVPYPVNLILAAGAGALVNPLFNAIGLHNGGDFIVPPGYPNDSFPIMVESGERVQVTPSSETGNSDNSETNDLLRALLAKPVANTVVFDDVSMSQYVDRGRKNRNSNIL